MTTRHMIPRLVAALPMISFWLIFFLWGNNGNDGATQTTTTITMVEAFSTPPIATGGGASATTWATRTRHRITTQQQQQQQPRTGSSSSLTAWRSSCPKVGKDGLYHITTEEEFRYVQHITAALHHRTLFCSIHPAYFYVRVAN